MRQQKNNNPTESLNRNGNLFFAGTEEQLHSFLYSCIFYTSLVVSRLNGGWQQVNMNSFNTTLLCVEPSTKVDSIKIPPVFNYKKRKQKKLPMTYSYIYSQKRIDNLIYGFIRREITSPRFMSKIKLVNNFKKENLNQTFN